MDGMIADRRKNPTDDLVTSSSTPRSRAQKLEDHQIVTEFLLLLIGGEETTRHTLSGALGSAAPPRSAPASSRRLGVVADRDREMLRWTAPVKNMSRTITADTDSMAPSSSRARR